MVRAGPRRSSACCAGGRTSAAWVASCGTRRGSPRFAARSPEHCASTESAIARSTPASTIRSSPTRSRRRFWSSFRRRSEGAGGRTTQEGRTVALDQIAPPIPDTMRAWALFGPDDLRPVVKPVPRPGPAEVLIKIEAVAICGTDIEILHRGLPAMVEGGSAFNGQHVVGHEYVGTVAALG